MRGRACAKGSDQGGGGGRCVCSLAAAPGARADCRGICLVLSCAARVAEEDKEKGKKRKRKTKHAAAPPEESTALDGRAGPKSENVVLQKSAHPAISPVSVCTH